MGNKLVRREHGDFPRLIIISGHWIQLSRLAQSIVAFGR
jgi:hypothetical protein